MKKISKITDVLSLLVFALFALCVLLVLLTGAKVYRNLVDKGEESFQTRTAAQYITTRIRQAEGVEAAEFEGIPALVIPETIDGECYVTYIYCREGWLWELYCAQGAALSPEDGEKVLKTDNLTLRQEAGNLWVQIGPRELFFRLGKEILP